MTDEMRQKLARESFEEKIRKVEALIDLAKRFPEKTKDAQVGEQAERRHEFSRESKLRQVR